MATKPQAPPPAQGSDMPKVSTSGEYPAGVLLLPRKMGLGALWGGILLAAGLLASVVRAEGRITAIEGQAIGARLQRTEMALCVICESNPDTARKPACVKICEGRP